MTRRGADGTDPPVPATMGGWRSPPDPSGTADSDAALRAAVSQKLVREGPHGGEELLVEAREGEVTLQGRVYSRQARDRAAGLAREVPGVTAVRNRIRVEARDTGAFTGQTTADVPGSAADVGSEAPDPNTP